MGPFECGTLSLCALSVEQQTKVAAAQAEAAAQTRLARTSTTLYLGDLDPTVKEATLYDIFSSMGPIESIDIYHDPVTQQNLGYASIRFQRPPPIGPETSNRIVIHGQPCRIMWGVPSAECQSPKEASMSIIVRHLDPSVTRKSLLDTFSYCGYIVSCQLATDNNGMSKGYAFIEYDTAGAAQRAVHRLNRLTLYGTQVEVQLYPHTQKGVPLAQGSQDANPELQIVYVDNLPLDMGEHRLRRLFEIVGPVVSVAIQRDATGDSTGSGHVQFECHEDADRALQQLANVEYLGQQLHVSRTKVEHKEEIQHHRGSGKLDSRPTKQHQTTNLYVKNLSEDVDDRRLHSAFSRFGVITSAKVMTDDAKGVSKGFGFVCFSTSEEAARALAGMNGAMLTTKPIYVAVAQRKEARRQQLETQMAHRAHCILQVT